MSFINYEMISLSSELVSLFYIYLLCNLRQISEPFWSQFLHYKRTLRIVPTHKIIKLFHLYKALGHGIPKIFKKTLSVSILSHL